MQTRDNGTRKEPLLPVCLCVCAKTHAKLDDMKNPCRHDCAYDPFGPLSSLLVRDKSLPALRRVVSSLGFHMALKVITFLFWFSGTLMCVPLCCVGGPRKEGHKIPHGLGKHLSIALAFGQQVDISWKACEVWWGRKAISNVTNMQLLICNESRGSARGDVLQQHPLGSISEQLHEGLMWQSELWWNGPRCFTPRRFFAFL